MTTSRTLGRALCALAFAAAAAAAYAEPPSPPLAMSTPRAAHAAVTLANGDVALIGGCVANGCEAGPGSRTVDIFDVATRRVAEAGTLAAPRIGAAAFALADGRILIAGGWSGRAPTPSVEIFDPRAKTGREVARLRRPRADIAVVALADGRIALIGGFDGRAAVGDVDIFDPKTGALTPAAALATPRAAIAAVTLADGRVLAAGGAETANGRFVPSGASELADAAVKTWRATRPLLTPRYKNDAVALADGRALVLGGSDARDREGKISTIEAFDPAAGAFTNVGQTLRPRIKIANAVVVLADGRVFIGGGATRAEVYDPRTQKSVLVGPDLGQNLSFVTASLLNDGRVLIAGGYEEHSIEVSRAVWLVRP